MAETLTWSLHGCALFCDTPLIRDSQHEASEAIEKAIAERRRKLPVTMAMGTGETLTAVNEVYRLMSPASLAGPVVDPEHWPHRRCGLQELRARAGKNAAGP